MDFCMLLNWGIPKCKAFSNIVLKNTTLTRVVIGHLA
jgi:hypothetical protein